MADHSLPKPCTVYALASSENNEIRYIGQTIRPLAIRLRRHIGDAHRDDNTPRARWIRKAIAAGFEILIFPLIENAVPNEDEIRLIAQYRQTHDLLNLVDGGQGCLNPTPEYRQQMSEQRKALWSTPERRAEAAERSRKTWADPLVRKARLESIQMAKSTPEFRKAQSARVTEMHVNHPHIVERSSEANRQLWADPEHRAKRIQALKDGLATPEYKEQLTARLLEQWQDPERRRAMSEKMKGRQFSDETIQKMSESAKRRYQESEHHAKGVKWDEARKARYRETMRQRSLEKLPDRPLCCDRPMVKLGKTTAGNQRYFCKGCKRTTINPWELSP